MVTTGVTAAGGEMQETHQRYSIKLLPPGITGSIGIHKLCPFENTEVRQFHLIIL